MASNNKNLASRVRKPKSSIRLSKAGYEFDMNETRWQLDANTSINLYHLIDFELESKFQNNFVKMLADYASEFSADYVEVFLIFVGCFFPIK